MRFSTAQSAKSVFRLPKGQAQDLVKCPINTDPEQSIAPGLKNRNGDRAYANRSAYVTKLVPTHTVRAQKSPQGCIFLWIEGTSQASKRLYRGRGIRYELNSYVPGGIILRSLAENSGVNKKKGLYKYRPKRRESVRLLYRLTSLRSPVVQPLGYYELQYVGSSRTLAERLGFGNESLFGEDQKARCAEGHYSNSCLSKQ